MLGMCCGSSLAISLSRCGPLGIHWGFYHAVGVVELGLERDKHVTTLIPFSTTLFSIFMNVVTLGVLLYVKIQYLIMLGVVQGLKMHRFGTSKILSRATNLLLQI